MKIKDGTISSWHYKLDIKNTKSWPRKKQNLVFNKYEYSGLKLSYILSVIQNDKQCMKELSHNMSGYDKNDCKIY
jgi:hypothetical protein